MFTLFRIILKKTPTVDNCSGGKRLKSLVMTLSLCPAAENADEAAGGITPAAGRAAEPPQAAAGTSAGLAAHLLPVPSAFPSDGRKYMNLDPLPSSPISAFHA